MFANYFIISILFFTSGSCVKLYSTGHENDHVNKSAPPMDLLDKSNLTLVSEGGTLKPNKPDMSLPKSDLNSLVSLEDEFPKTKQKSVVPRKGVDMLAVDIASNKVNNTLEEDLANKITPALQKLNTSIIESPVHVKKQSNITSDSNKTPVESTTSHVVKKPMILSDVALANMEKTIQSEQAKINVAPSTKSFASSQIPSPNENSKPKIYTSKATSHPGMIMPIVITILVVPMFAIVGYMALKRGQEAWKNRHYKRMDFLLDGMYND